MRMLPEYSPPTVSGSAAMTGHSVRGVNRIDLARVMILLISTAILPDPIELLVVLPGPRSHPSCSGRLLRRLPLPANPSLRAGPPANSGPARAVWDGAPTTGSAGAGAAQDRAVSSAPRAANGAARCRPVRLSN